jgi:hypothetical protein
MGNTGSVEQEEQRVRVQHFYIENGDSGLYLGKGDNDRLEVGKIEQGSKDAFLWSKDGKMIRNISGGVVDIAEGRKEEGARVITYPGHGGKNQQWSWEEGRLVSSLAGLVLQCGKGGEVAMAVRGEQGQQWRLEHQGEHFKHHLTHLTISSKNSEQVRARSAPGLAPGHRQGGAGSQPGHTGTDGRMVHRRVSGW